jgi:hypothetical protein
MRLNLTGAQIKMLRKALQASFTQADLTILLQEEANRRLADLTPLPGEATTIFFDVIKRAEMQCWTDNLVLGAAAWRPGDEQLAQCLRELGITPGSASRLSISESITNSSVASDAASVLEGIVRKSSHFVEVGRFLARLDALQAQICRIEINGRGIGTGFLIGDDQVLTNKHVRDVMSEQGPPVHCRFDYRALADGITVRAGQLVALANPDWLIAERPYAESDVVVGGQPPAAEQLDYALLRLAEPVARFPSGRDSDEAPEAAARGSIAFDDIAPPTPGSELYVLQHPNAQPLKLAVGRVLEGGNPMRLRHDAPTEPGSSGSPCFDADLRLVALHHAADPENLNSPRYNQAIPIGLIVADLKGKR